MKAVVESLNAASGDALFALYGAGMQQAFPVPKTREFVAGVSRARGRIVASAPLDPQQQGVYVLDAERGRWRLELHVDGDAKITGLKITSYEPEPPRPLVVQNQIALRLPYRGAWSVSRLHGDTSPSDQRRAVDLRVVDDNGSSHRGAGAQNEDYYAWGKEIVAAADGKVVIVVDGVPENVPGAKNGYHVPGNEIIVEHAPDLYSMYAHLRPGTLRVRAGQKVRKGQVLALCGNSGNSTEPHLHFQLQDGPRSETAWGVEPVFDGVRVVRDGKETAEQRYVLRAGDRVSTDEK